MPDILYKNIKLLYQHLQIFFTWKTTMTACCSYILTNFKHKHGIELTKGHLQQIHIHVQAMWLHMGDVNFGIVQESNYMYTACNIFEVNANFFFVECKTEMILWNKTDFFF